jgi:hypothetical protein
MAISVVNKTIFSPNTSRLGAGSFNLSSPSAIGDTLVIIDQLNAAPFTFTLTQATGSGTNTIYTGTISFGASNNWLNEFFKIAGFGNSANNGIFKCVASSATSLTLQNISGVNETHAATAVSQGATGSVQQQIYVTDQGETFTYQNGIGNGNMYSSVQTLLTTKVATTINFSRPSANATGNWPEVVVYEISGTSLSVVAQHVNQSISQVATFTPTVISGTSGQNTFYVGGCGTNDVRGGGSGAVSSVNSPWTADIISDNPMQAASAWEITTSGSQSPTFNISPPDFCVGIVVAISESSSGPTPTTTVIVSSQNPSTFGQLVTFTATVNGPGGPGSPTGTATFNIDGSSVATVAVMSVSAGVSQAQYATASLSVGTHPVFASYSGDSNYSTSTSPTIQQVVQQPVPAPTGNIATDFGNSTADVIWWHTGFTGYDEETLGNEGLINTGGTPNIPWLLGLSVSMGNAMTEAIARQSVIYCEPEYGWDGGGGGNEAGGSQIGAGGSSNGLIVSW